LRVHIEKEFDLAKSPILGNEDQVIWIDIETKKVPVSARVAFPSKMRWSPFMVSILGATDPGILYLETFSGTEEEIIREIGSYAEYEIRYDASREFDEMVLRGRFTNARRAHRAVAGPWPNVDHLKIRWRNIRQVRKPLAWDRNPDVESKNVPEEWEKGNHLVVAEHCLRDVIETFLRDPEIKLSKPLQRKLERELV
jgi:hypothetical protein